LWFCPNDLEWPLNDLWWPWMTFLTFYVCRVPFSKANGVRVLSHSCILISSNFIRKWIILSICCILWSSNIGTYSIIFQITLMSFQDKWTYLYSRTKRRFRRIDWDLKIYKNMHVAPHMSENMKKMILEKMLVVMNSHQNIVAIFEFYCKMITYPESGRFNLFLSK